MLIIQEIHYFRPSYKTDMKSTSLLLTIIFSLFIKGTGYADPIVKTTLGYVSGKREKGCYVFKGIPYAAPPVGDLRFKAPVRMQAWKDTLACTAFGPEATQYGADAVKGNEDCLTLNLYTPGIKPRKRMPVLIWVHGGGMTSGSGKGQNGHAFSDRDSIITITINYRLGVFGFLYMGDVPGYQTAGNNALLDCIMALKWVKENIKAFGGDPNQVTVIGESAGAKLASTLLVTPAARGYFNKLILESGAVQCIRDSATAKAIRQRLMDTLKISDPVALLKLPATTLITAQAKVCKGVQGTNYFGPLEDGKIIQGDALEYVRTHPDKRVSVLLGTNKAESLLFVNIDKRLSHPDSTVLSDWFGDNYHYILTAYQNAVNNKLDAAAIVTLSRYMYQMHTFRLAKALAAQDQMVWMYSFEQMKNGEPATHGEELAYVWYEPGNGPAPVNPALATYIHARWVDFIKGRPIWAKYDKNRFVKVFDDNSRIEMREDYDDPEHPTMGFILH